MVLKEFRPTDAATIASWAGSEAEALAWCGRARPGPSAFEEWHRDPDVSAFVLLQDGEPVAYGELWIETHEVELGRLIVRPSARGRGIGRALVEALLARASDRPAFVRVLPENAPALACYRGAGFARVSPEEEARFNDGQPRTYVWLRFRPGR
jgi:ribosomal protein S18 acetylase RimI-like enzyme